jgi:hypothetical protein
MKYRFLRDNTWEEVTPEVWKWEAHYYTGEVLKQFGDDGIFHQFQEIDQTKLSVFKMVSDGKPDYTLIFSPEKMKLIHYYKRSRLNIGTDQEVFITVYCFGYETKTFNRTNKVNVMIMPTGETILAEDTNSVEIK